MLTIQTYKPKQFTDLVERIWILENQEEEIDLLVPPNQYMSLIIPLERSEYARNGKQLNLPVIEGLSVQTARMKYPAGTKLVGIRFYAYGLLPFFKMEGKALVNEAVEIDLGPDSSGLFQEVMNNDELVNTIDALLKELFSEKEYQKILSLKDYYGLVRWRDESLSIEEYCEQNGTNYKTLNRWFSKITGLGTKRFERLIKFRKSLCALIDSKEQLTSIGVDSGYFDQAHFIREFKLFLNCTPSRYQELIKSADKDTQVINYNFRLF